MAVSPHPDCFAIRPLPRAGEVKNRATCRQTNPFSRRSQAPELCFTRPRQKQIRPQRGSGAPKGACQPSPPRKQACASAPLVCVRAAARILRGALAFRRSAAALARANASAVGSAPVSGYLYSLLLSRPSTTACTSSSSIGSFDVTFVRRNRGVVGDGVTSPVSGDSGTPREIDGVEVPIFVLSRKSFWHSQISVTRELLF